MNNNIISIAFDADDALWLLSLERDELILLFTLTLLSISKFALS